MERCAALGMWSNIRDIQICVLHSDPDPPTEFRCNLHYRIYAASRIMPITKQTYFSFSCRLTLISFALHWFLLLHFRANFMISVYRKSYCHVKEIYKIGLVGSASDGRTQSNSNVVGI